LAYVANRFSNNVSVVNTSTHAVVATVTVGALPFGVAVRPDGERAYVTNFVGNSVSVINTATNTVVATVSVGTGPNNPAVTPDGTRLYVPNGSSDNVSVINTATNAVVATVAVGDDPRHLAITPDGTRAYVSNSASGNLSVIDTNPASPAFHTVIATVATATFSRGIAITPNGARAYVAVGLGIFPGPDQVKVVDTNPASPTVHTVLATITVQSSPLAVAITPDGTRVYVVNNGSNSVSVISTATNTVTATLSPGAGDPQGIAITSDGAKVIDTNPASGAFHTVLATVALGSGPAGVAITPASADLALTKTDSPDPVIAGGTLSYTITVTNSGPGQATWVTLTDALPAGLTFVSARPSKGSCTQAGGTVTCNLGTFPAPAAFVEEGGGNIEGVEVSVSIFATGLGSITNTASVTASTPDANPANNSASQTTTIIPPPAIPGVSGPGLAVLAGLLLAALLWALWRAKRQSSASRP
jgi:uncharacterized repeat protein (TIGR01451 family)